MRNDSSFLGSFLLKWKRPADRFNQFLKDHHHLFTLIGVFVALAGYIQSIGNSLGASRGLLDATYIATFALVSILVVSAYTRLGLFIVESDFGPLTKENIGVTAFGVAFAIIIFIIARIISNLPDLWFTLIAPIVLLSAIIGGLYLVGFTLKLAEAIAKRTKYSCDFVGVAVLLLLWFAIPFVANTNLVDPSISDSLQPGISILKWGHFFLSSGIAIAFFINSIVLIVILLANIKKKIGFPSSEFLTGSDSD